MEIKNVKGTHDVILKEAVSYQRIEEMMRSLVEVYGFNEFRTPVIEDSSLFRRGVGESSDIVQKEMYDFVDKGNRNITLRPEYTAGVVRAFVNAKLHINEALPVKAYYFGPLFRYERPQLGRYRQFEQFGVEILGVDNILRDVEAIDLGYQILNVLGLHDVKIKINSLGDDISRENYKKALKDYFSLKISSMCGDCQKRFEINPLRILDCKDPDDKAAIEGAPNMFDFLSEEAKNRFNKVLEMLSTLNIPYEIDHSLVRGLDYYAETVFEFHYVSKQGKNYGAIGAGGHYDKLIAELGGPKNLHGVGFSFGIERIHAVLIDDGIIEDKLPELDLYVMPIGEEATDTCFQLTSYLRSYGFSCDIHLSGGKMSKMFSNAEKRNARFALIIGGEEISSQKVILKNLKTKEQTDCPLDCLIEKLDELLHEKSECDCGCGEHCHCSDKE